MKKIYNLYSTLSSENSHIRNYYTLKYIETEQLSYCKTVMIQADSMAKELHLFPKSHVVELKFYRGRYNMFEEEYKAAKDDLEFALNLCHKDATNSKL